MVSLSTAFNTENNIHSFRDSVKAILTTFEIQEGASERIVESYTEPWRTYHNTKHLSRMWQEAKKLTLSEEEYNNLLLLILYHDVWYKVGRPHGENEHRSVAWAIEDITNGASLKKERIEELLTEGILATSTHTLEGVQEKHKKVTAFLLDLDLWGLGQLLESFKNDTENVWKESWSVVTREEFDVNRAHWAKRILEHPTIYHSPEFTHLEVQARKNLSSLFA